MDSIKASMTSMTLVFTKWMEEVRQMLSQPIAAAVPEIGTKHPINNDPSSPIPKRADTQTTPTWNDPMETDNPWTHLFIESAQDTHISSEQATLPPLLPGPMTQPIQPQSPPHKSDCPQPQLPPTPTSPYFESMESMMEASASPTYPPGYDVDDPSYVYTKKRDHGSLFCVG
jgi:hypothetical protein